MFSLPKSTIVKTVVPKNKFDGYTNTRQKKLFADKVLRITWANKLSFATVGLEGKDINEIQIFLIELKEQCDIKEILTIIDKVIPYHIIFTIRFKSLYYVSTSVKHTHPANENQSVMDYTFKSNWLEDAKSPFVIRLKNNLDFVFQDFCEQFSTVSGEASDVANLVKRQKEFDSLNRQITQLESRIARHRQFNKKVELNMKLQELRSRVANLRE